VRQLAV
jgi:hypothetical protein